MNLGNTIKAIRKEKGIKQKQLALSLNVTVGTLVRIEKHNTSINKTLMNKILKELDIDEVYLHWRALEESDIKPNKVEAFKMLHPLMTELFKSYN